MKRRRVQASAEDRASSLGRDLPRYGTIALAVFLGWQMIRAPLEDRAPPAVAIRISPTSAVVLRRAAEEEFAEGRLSNARSLAGESLTRDPFSARALRVLGLTYAKTDTTRADDLVTLAGNWSLRDDPSHAWLVEYRLRQGDYISAFAHADTLARRRPDLYPQLFRLFVVASSESPKALGALAGLLSRSPPWRDVFLEHLYGIPEGDALLGSLALATASREGRFTDVELSHLYQAWANRGHTAGLKYLRRRMGRPTLDRLIQNGDFSGPRPPEPFTWVVESAPGLNATISADENGENNEAFRVRYNGLGRSEVAYQLLLLEPGRYELRGRTRVQEGTGVLPLAWTVTCLESTQVLLEHTITGPESGNPEAWTPFSETIVVPPTRCSGQWLRLVTRPSDRRISALTWTDNLELLRLD